MMPSLPSSSSFTIPDAYKKDYLGHDRLLLHDNEDQQLQIEESLYAQPEGRILIWSSDIQLNLLFNSEKLFMDGTFSSAPPYFNQVYIIHAIHHETCKLFFFNQVF
jgi:hypothetical protein